MGEMNNMMDTATESGDKYFLQEQELWESLGFDWEGWNATSGENSATEIGAEPVRAGVRLRSGN